MGTPSPGDGRRGATYAFGDVDAAALRLQLMDRVFRESTRSLLNVPRPRPIELAIDLGCGPGLSTHLIDRCLHPTDLVGLDNSQPFLETARAALPRATFFLHDVSTVPFPAGSADVIHARFVLSHLAAPESILISWLSQLNPGGYLLTQDDERIVADHPVLTAYEKMARSLVAHRGGDLWVGSRLAEWSPPRGFRTIVNCRYRQEVPASVSAQLFGMNFAVWRHDPFIVRSHSGAALQAMAGELALLATSGDPGHVVFDIRQLAIRRE